MFNTRQCFRIKSRTKSVCHSSTMSVLPHSFHLFVCMYIVGLPEDTLATEDHPRLPDNNDETPVVDNVDSPFIETEHVHSEQVLDSSEMRDESPVEDDFDQEDQPEGTCSIGDLYNYLSFLTENSHLNVTIFCPHCRWYCTAQK